MAAPSPSVRVAQAQISIMLLASAAITAYARDLKEKGYIAHLSRFITLVLCGAYLVPGSVHRFKEDSGMLSIARPAALLRCSSELHGNRQMQRLCTRTRSHRL